MKSSRSLLSIAVGLAVSFLSVAAKPVRALIEPAFVTLKAAVFGPIVALAHVDEQPASLPRVKLRRAAQFVLRLLKREWPEVTPDWRLVPST